MVLYQHFLTLAGGLCFMIFGMSLAADNLQILCADRVRALLRRVVKLPLLGVLCGILLTVLLQSSGASITLLVNMASNGVATLTQVMSIIIGATIGTTFTVQLISFDITSIALYVLIGGFAMHYFAKNKRVSEWGAVILGFGFIFYGLKIMGGAVTIIKDVPSFRELVGYFNFHPFSSLLFALVLTAVVQSSAVAIGLVMTLAASGLMSLEDAFYWVLGANVGTTATALVASFGGEYTGRQVAWAHVFYKMAAVLMVLVVVEPFCRIIRLTSTDISHQVANAHTLFNVAAALIFYPFTGWGAQVIERLFPKPAGEKEFAAKYLDARALSAPAQAYANGRRELERMAELTVQMVRKSITAFEKDDPDFVAEMKALDTRVDLLNREIKMYLVRLTEESLAPNQLARVIALIALVNDVENIGDLVVKNLMSLAQKKSFLKVSFSDEGWQEMLAFHGAVVDNLDLALSAFSLHNRELAQRVIARKHEIRLMEQKLREHHIGRLQRHLQMSFNTSDIHMDLLSVYRRINSYGCNLAYPIINADSTEVFPSSPSEEVLLKSTKQS